MIDIWYKFIDILIPFNWAEPMFMKNALLAVILVMPIFGILGTMVVNNKMAFFSDALGHGAFTGIAIGGFFGLLNSLWAATIFSIVFSIFITLIKSKSNGSTDTIIGVFSSTAIAFGLFLISFGGSSFNKYTSYLVGDLLSAAPKDLLMLAVMLLMVLLLWIAAFNKILMISINPSLASSRGVSILIINLIFTISIAVIVTISIQWVGLLIINSMLILPAASARNISSNVRQYHISSISIALVSGISGLILSYYLNTITSATIVLISSVFFFITLYIKK